MKLKAFINLTLIILVPFINVSAKNKVNPRRVIASTLVAKAKSLGKNKVLQVNKQNKKLVLTIKKLESRINKNKKSDLKRCGCSSSSSFSSVSNTSNVSKNVLAAKALHAKKLELQRKKNKVNLNRKKHLKKNKKKVLTRSLSSFMQSLMSK